MPFLVSLSVLHAFDNQLEVEHIKIQMFLPQLFRVSDHLLSSLLGQLHFQYFHFFLTHLDIVY